MDELVQGMDLDAYAAKHADHANMDEDDKDVVMERYACRISSDDKRG